MKKIDEYFKLNINESDKRDIKVEWITDGKGNNKNLRVLSAMDKVIWKDEKEKIIDKNVLDYKLKRIEYILGMNGAQWPIKVMTTVEDIRDKVEITPVSPVLPVKKLPIKKKEVKKKVVKEKNLMVKDHKNKLCKLNIKEVYGAYSKDNYVFNEINNKKIGFNEIIGFRIFNKLKNINICLDYWKDDEKIVLRVEDKSKVGDNSRILLQKTLKELKKDEIEEEINSGYN